MLSNFPEELKILQQWVCATNSKVPINPRTKQKASPTNPDTWVTFEEAYKAGYPHIGFVLTKNDPYCVIDLDNKPEKPCTEEELKRHQKIFDKFVSYTELSTSGSGVHILLKGQVPTGVNRNHVEVYSDSRYIICTGNIIRPLPISDQYQELLTSMYYEMQPMARTELVEIASSLSDEEVYEMAANATNADKFHALCSGDWASMGYISQSEADLALLSILAFYTKDNEQVRRLFRMSGLGKREKAQKNDRYLNFALEKIRAHEPPPIDLSQLKLPEKPAIGEAPIPPIVQNDPYQTKCLSSLTLPPGLVGEIAQYIYSSAVRPVPEVALGGALALLAGIVARTYNISGSGLNQYLVLIAKTGIGKEGASNGIDNLLAAVRPSIPMIDQFVGPSSFASGQALIKVLDEKPCFFSILGEFGLTLQQVCDPRANSAQIMLKKVLLDIFGKSGWNKVLRSSVYADAEKNTKTIQAPNASFLGDSTPETFFDGLDLTHIAEGLIPRFSIIEYKGKRPPRNKDANHPPSKALTAQISDLVAICLTMANNGTNMQVQMNHEAHQLMDDFDTKADSLINTADNMVVMQLWNRAHLKALKLAALIAVGCNPHNPIITTVIAEWSISFIERDICSLVNRFSDGEIGNGEHRHEAIIRDAINHFFTLGSSQKAAYGVPKAILDQRMIPYSYLRRKLRLLTAFKNDRRGSARALQESIKDMVAADILHQVPQQQLREKFSISSEVYIIGESW